MEFVRKYYQQLKDALRKKQKPPVLNRNALKQNAALKKAINDLEKKLESRTYFGGVPIAKIGSASVNGAVFAMNMNNKSRKVLKIVQSPKGKKEFDFQTIAASLNVAPKVYKLKEEINIPPHLPRVFFNGHVKTINAFLMNNLKRSNTDKVYSMANFARRAFPDALKRAVFHEFEKKAKKTQESWYRARRSSSRERIRYTAHRPYI